MTAYVFDEFALDADRGSLTRSGREIVLRPKSFDLLRHLLKNPGKLISKDELLSTVWPGVHVSEDSLTQCVMEVRKALSDEEHLLVKTVPKRGYMFVGAVSAREDFPRASESPGGPSRSWGRAATLVLSGLVAGAALATVLPYVIGELRAALFPGQVVIERLTSQAETAIGQSLTSYPSGSPVISVDVVPLPPGTESGWHSHPVPILGYVLEGQFTTDYGSRGIRTYKAGDVVLEAVDWPHNVQNHGKVPTRTLVITLGVEGQEPRVFTPLGDVPSGEPTAEDD